MTLRGILSATRDGKVVLGRDGGHRHLERLERSAERYEFLAGKDDDIAF